MFTRLWRCLVVWWKLSSEVWQVVYGMYRITKLPTPCVTIFGGSRLAQDSFYAHQAGELAGKLALSGLAVLTGGGPGIMEAANCGVVTALGGNRATFFSMGIGISNMRHETGLNPCVGERIVLDYFFARKWLLLNYSIGFVVFPGGLGTIDELSDLLNLMTTQRRSMAPIILIGSEFWKPYRTWVEHARRERLLSQDYEPEVLVTDDIDYAVTYLVSYCAACKKTQQI